MSRYRILLAASIASVGWVGCTTGVNEARPSGESRSSSTVVIAADLSREPPTENLMDALRRIRPALLDGRGSKLMVVIDASPPMELSVLEMLRVSAVAEVRLLRASSSVGRSALSSDGRVTVGDLLLVRTQSGR
jgi:hypothetical protein